VDGEGGGQSWRLWEQEWEWGGSPMITVACLAVCFFFWSQFCEVAKSLGIIHIKISPNLVISYKYGSRMF
jgi:hypothetical protein